MIISKYKFTDAISELWDYTLKHGLKSSPRGMEVTEIFNATISYSPSYPFQEFHNRKYDIEYFKAEMRWKLGASKYDDSIKAYAKMWEEVQNPDGTFNSNYGQFWFGPQAGIWHVVTELIRDQDSRRAVIPMLSAEHLTPYTKDTVCTECITFYIRENTLHMTVHMRSSDQVFGLGTDAPTFATLYWLVHALLGDVYKNLNHGRITITAVNSHIYSRHYSMVRKCLDELDHPTLTPLPYCVDSAEAMQIISSRGRPTDNAPGPLLRFLGL